MTILHWPQEDRPREKLLGKGEQSLTTAELLAIVLSTGTRGKNAVEMARELLTEYGNLRQLWSTPMHALIRKKGFGQAKYASFRAAVELGRRYLNELLPAGTTLNSSQKTQQFLAQQLRHHSNEVFACLFMDSHFRLICFEELFYGTVNEAHIHPREIVRRGLLHNAVNIILAHNHPSGNPTPSAADKEITQQIKQALELMDINVVDHVIVGNPKNYSFAEAGLI